MKLDQQEQGLTKNKIEVVEKKKNEIRYIGSKRFIKGLTLFSYNRVTGEIKKAPMKSTAVLTESGLVLKNEVITEKDCFYDQALNEKNFIKHLKKYGVIKRKLNHRWVLFCEKFGIDVNREGSMSDFMGWITSKASEYKKENGVSLITDQEDFDRFLKL